jgi:uncharacterized small protein (DUF1192 family)
MSNHKEHIKSAQLDQLVRCVNKVYQRRLAVLEPFDYMAEYAAEQWRDQTIQRLHSVVKPSARPYAGLVIAQLLEETLANWQAVLEQTHQAKAASEQQAMEYQGALTKVQRLEHQVADLQQRITALQAKQQRLTAQLQRQPKQTQVEIPAQTVVIRSEIQQEILRLMATEGLARSWRIIERVLAAEISTSENSVRNSLRDVTKKRLVEDYTEQGRPVGWSPVPGGVRRLVTLTSKGGTIAEGLFQIDVVPSELEDIVQQHKSVSHAVGILEARDHLREQGYVVDDAPDALLAEEGLAWGTRTEPDLMVTLNGESWPVEVQREVACRRNEKWGKALRLAEGRLVLIVFSREMQEKQRRFLQQANRRRQLPPGEIRLASLEAMEDGDWRWDIVRT